MKTTAIKIVKHVLNYLESADKLEKRIREAKEMMPAKSVSVLLNEARSSGSKGIKAWEHELVALMNETERIQRQHSQDNDWLIQRFDNFTARIKWEHDEAEKYHDCYSDKEGSCKICGRKME